MEDEKEVIDLRSEAVRDFLERPPQWLVRWGTLSLFVVLMIVFAIGWLIHYPTIVSVNFRLISDNLPKAVIVKTDGRIEKLFVKDNQHVKTGEILAYVESNSAHQEILNLEKELDEIGKVLKGDNMTRIGQIRLRNFEHLGEVQNAYQSFQQSFVQIKALYADGFYQKKRELLVNAIARSETMDKQLSEQRDIYVKDSELAEKEFNVNKKLHTEKVIADLEIYREESKALAKQLPIKNIETSRINNETQKNAKQNELLELDRTVQEQTENFGQVLNTLRSAIEYWKSRYLLIAPTAGNVFFSSILQEKQTLKTGTEVMYIGTSTKNYLGEIRIPQTNSGRVRPGQRVLVKFHSFPFEEYGAVEGKIAYISKVPSADDTYFVATVSLPYGLRTNFNKILVYKTGMTASGEIITEDLRLVERLFYQGRKLLLSR